MNVIFYMLLLVVPGLAFSDDVQTQLDNVQLRIQQQNEISANSHYPHSNDLGQVFQQLETASPDDAQGHLDDVQQSIEEQNNTKMPNRDIAYQQRINEANEYGQNRQADDRVYRERLNNANRYIDNPGDRNQRFMSEAGRAYQGRLRSANNDIKHPNNRNKGNNLTIPESTYQQRLNDVTGSIKNSGDGDDGGSCDVTMCMFGMVAGGGGSSECSGSVGKFFGIQAFTGMGDFDPVKTEVKRKTFLKQCDKGVDNQIDSIISKFGQVQG